MGLMEKEDLAMWISIFISLAIVALSFYFRGGSF